MTEVPIGLLGTTNPCYLFYMRLQDCVSRESLFKLMCKEQYDDWQECKFAKRHVIFN
jgi:hypothetical protein